jgi:hypothetical protein
MLANQINNQLVRKIWEKIAELIWGDLLNLCHKIVFGSCRRYYGQYLITMQCMIVVDNDEQNHIKLLFHSTYSTTSILGSSIQEK